MNLTSKFDAAFIYASRIHAGQIRKKSRIPRLAHLMSVASIALEYGANESEAIAALLHDAIEDGGGWPRLDEIRDQFGDHIAAIVDGCTDREITPRPPWRDRKQAYLDHLAKGSHAVRLVAAADKLHNARCLLRDYRQEKDRLWNRYSGGRDGTLWYYESLVRVLKTGAGNVVPLVEELERVVTEIKRLVECQEGGVNTPEQNPRF